MARLYGPGPEEPPKLIPSGDLAGLSTMDVEDRPVGELYGTLAEEDTGLIRYLDVSVRGQDRHVLVPIGHARIEHDSTPPRVRLRAATFEDLMAVPAFPGDGVSLDRGFHEGVLAAHGQLFLGAHYYAHPAYDPTGLHAADDMISGPAEGTRAEERLRPLSELSGYRVRVKDEDIRGGRLLDEHGVEAGTVTEMLVDVEALKVRYLIVQLDDPDRATALPVGYAEIGAPGEGPQRTVWTPTLSREDLRLLPPYAPPLSREEENRIHAAIEGRLSGPRYFDRPDFRPG